MIARIMKRFGFVRPQDILVRMPERAFSGANTGRLHSTWGVTNYSADTALRGGLPALRARSRDLEENDDYAKKFLRMVKTNVAGGPKGIKLQSRAVTGNFKPDDYAQKLIEEQWHSWGQKGVCDVTGRYSFRAIQQLAVSSVARDGEVLLRFVPGYDNDFKFAVQLIEADHLDHTYNDRLKNGNIVKMGVELNEWGRPVAYHILTQHPGDNAFTQVYGERIRVPADEVIHLFIPYRISQNRGLPWMHTALARLKMLGSYQEAELVAARIGAAKGGFYEKGEGSYQGDDTEDGNPIQEVEPGIFEILPRGWKFTPYDPQHPNNAFPDFEKAMLRGISSGIDVAYNNLANDLEGVNYSSLRAGLLDERDQWRNVQNWAIEDLCNPVFRVWLKYSLLTQQVKLPQRAFSRLALCEWQARGWQWVDPEKDVKAKILAIENGIDTEASVAAEQGKDVEDIYKQRARENEMREKYGLQPIGALSNGKEAEAAADPVSD